MDNTKNIGLLIKEKVAEKKIKVAEFAKMIDCKRSNAYNIFERTDISIIQLKKISEVLKHNFFEDLAKNPDLIKEIDESEETKKEQAIYTLILEEIPNILKEIKREDYLIFTPQNQEYPTPDFGFVNHPNISITINESLEKRIGESKCFPIEKLKSKIGYEIEVCTIKHLVDNILVPLNKIINITIDKVYKREELKGLLELAFKIYDSL